MRSRSIHFLCLLVLLVTCMFNVKAEDQSARMEKLKKLMELAIDQFQLNRIIESRAALERMMAEKITDEEAFNLRKIFGEKIIFQMQKYGNRPVLNIAERQAMTYLGEAAFALDMGNKEKALDRVQKLVEVFKKNGYEEKSFEVERAEDIKGELEKADGKNLDELHKINDRVTAWKEELQSVGNTPLIILSRAQKYEQDQLRTPEQIKSVVSQVVKNPQQAQLALIEVERLGVYAVPELIKYLQYEKNTSYSINAQFVLISLGDVVTVPLCEALKTDNQILLQHLCNVLGEMRPTDIRALPFIKAVYEDEKNLASTRKAAGEALNKITGKSADQLLSAADYFLASANKYYLGGPEVDNEIISMNGTYWVWDKKANNNKGTLKEITVPSFILADFIAEELAFRNILIAKNKVPGQVLLASIFLQEKSRVDITNKLLKHDNMTLPGAEKMRKDANVWNKRLTKNNDIAYSMGPDYLSAVLSKALVDKKPEIAILAMDGIVSITADKGWQTLSKLKLPGMGAEVVAGVEPMIKALDDTNERVASAAAISLVKIGMPASDANYQKLLPVLVRGSEENQATIALMISNSPKLRQNIYDNLNRAGIIPMQATDGYAGFVLATKYPPKDAIIIDSRIDQFDSLRLQLELRNVSHGKVLPLIIITTRDHAENIAKQFNAEEIQQLADREQVTTSDVVNNQNNAFANQSWQTIIRHDIKEDNDAIFEDLMSIGRFTNDKQNVIILTNSTREGRYKLKENLMIKAERSLRSTNLSEYSRIRNEERVMGDIFGVRSTYVPVFVDEEISGYDVMKTVQVLQTDPRTRPVPIAILVDKNMLEFAQKDFEYFIKDNKIQVLPRDVDGKELVKTIEEMKKNNVLSVQNYSRILSNNIAERSCDALANLDVAAFSKGLSVKEQKTLTDIIGDQTRPEELKIAAAEALGHFKATASANRLIQLFNNISKDKVELRKAILAAIGKIDIENKYMDFKLKAMNESSKEIQQQASIILGPAAQNAKEIEKYVLNLRPNDPLSLTNPNAEADKEESAEEYKQVKETKEAKVTKEEKEVKEEAKEETKPAEEKKETKKADDSGFDW